MGSMHNHGKGLRQEAFSFIVFIGTEYKSIFTLGVDLSLSLLQYMGF